MPGGPPPPVEVPLQRLVSVPLLALCSCPSFPSHTPLHQGLVLSCPQRAPGKPSLVLPSRWESFVHNAPVPQGPLLGTPVTCPGASPGVELLCSDPLDLLCAPSGLQMPRGPPQACSSSTAPWVLSLFLFSPYFSSRRSQGRFQPGFLAVTCPSCNLPSCELAQLVLTKDLFFLLLFTLPLH